MLVPDLLQVAMLEIRVHDFRGAYHEAFAALKHANKIANYVGAGAACVCDIAAADLYLRSLPLNSLLVRQDKLKNARARIDMVDGDYLTATNTMNTLISSTVKARILAAEEEPEEQLELLNQTLKQLEGLFDIDAFELRTVVASPTVDADALADQMATMKLDKQSKPTKNAKTKSTGPKSSRKPKAKTAQPDTAEPSKKDIDYAPLAQWHGSLLRETVLATLSYYEDPDFEGLYALLEKAGTMVKGPQSAAAQAQSLASGRLLLRQAAEQMTADITFNALQDSIVAMPAPTQPGSRGVQQPQAVVPTKTPRKAKAAPKPTKANVISKTNSISIPLFVSLLEKAYEQLQHSWNGALNGSRIAHLREQSRLISSISLTTSAFAQATSIEVVHPLVCAYHTDLPSIRTQALNRIVDNPGVEKLSKDDLKTWPTLERAPAQQELTSHDRANFQQDFIDIIPQAWNVVSLSLTDQGTAMNLARYRQGQSPFILRVPFAHRESDDPDEEVLDMSLAYERLRGIIKQHEFTAVEAGVTDKPEYKRKWWQKKHELDAELRLLLNDVEGQWFSAVKGVFLPQSYDAQALSKFQAQLQTILLEHCPMKKGKGKGKSALHDLKLETGVLELFIGFGDPASETEVEGEDGLVIEVLAETAMMADGVHDLVQLILENLQFSGESIAVDEVDMDNVIIKIIDALKEYYAATTKDQTACHHTILILDNQLHGFPWESLPCLRNRSISRLPSLADLRNRILAAHLAAPEEQRPGKTISRTSGTSLLNPSGDLTKTAQRFQPWLHKLPDNWAHLQVAPDDEGWRNMLFENDLFLYVGHGSTSQYVRPRVVKRLGYEDPGDRGQTCAVSWLIGCGSVAVEDLGEFEPSGMVLSYLAAGSPAVLGALWDVGDIDADHFSITAGDYWGLWEDSSKGLDAKLVNLRKKISEEKKALGRSMSMCEAVAKSRGGCKLPYLNGAAFVVYGIPVFLD
jgi:separase